MRHVASMGQPKGCGEGVMREREREHGEQRGGGAEEDLPGGCKVSASECIHHKYLSRATMDKMSERNCVNVIIAAF